MTAPVGVITLRVPLRLPSGEEITFRLQVSDEDARTLVQAPRRVIRSLDPGLTQQIKEGLDAFLKDEKGKRS